MAHVSQRKKDIVNNLTELAKKYNVIALLDMEGMPANTLQEMREKLRKHAKIVMTKKRLMKIVFNNVESEKNNIVKLEEHFRGMPALLFTEENPFKIASILKKSRTPAHAKAGQIAPKDIVVKAGPTSFPPGPIISELGSIGLKTGVEGGKVAIKEDKVVVKQGEVIPPKVAEVLTRLDIKPVELGLTMTAAYENGIIYTQDVLEVDEQYYIDLLKEAAFESFAVALHNGIITEETVKPLLDKAAREAFLLAVHENILNEDTAKFVLAKAEGQASSVKAKANL